MSDNALDVLAVLVEWIANVDGAPAPTWITRSRPYLDACELLRAEGVLCLGEDAVTVTEKETKA